MTYRYIYKITCTTGSLKDKFYYGQHTTDNLDDGYKGSGVMIQRYYKKHPNDYIKEIISYHENKSELDNAEISIISKYINDDNCLNLSPGGFGGSVKGIKNPNYGKHLSEETKKKLSEAHKGKPSNLSEESRNKISEVHKNQIPWNKGKKCGPLSEEHRKKISESGKGKIISEEQKQIMSIKHSGEGNPMFGKSPWNKGKKCGHLSEETKRKMSEARKGRISPNKGKTTWNKGIKLLWITLNNNHKQIKEEELQKYIDAGWHRGRK